MTLLGYIAVGWFIATVVGCYIVNKKVRRCSEQIKHLHDDDAQV